MHFDSLASFKRSASAAPQKGPVAIVLVEDDVEIATTLRHHQQLGFVHQIVFMPRTFDLPSDLEASWLIRVDYDVCVVGATEAAVNAVIAAVPDGTWLYYCYNAEFLFFPFCETRTVGEMLAFHEQEHRDAMLTCVVDLYDDVLQCPNAVSLDRAHLDRTGYYALGRKDADGHVHEKQLDFFGGLRWRFEEYVPADRRRIDRIGLFRARRRLTLLDGHMFNNAEYNTYSCKWHHNITATICSFRTAKALRLNPRSSQAIKTFKWHNTTRFEWHSQQLLDLGLMESGQWF